MPLGPSSSHCQTADATHPPRSCRSGSPKMGQIHSDYRVASGCCRRIRSTPVGRGFRRPGQTAFGDIRSGKWCPICARKQANETKRKNLKPDAKRRYYSIEDLQDHAQKLGGDCLSSRYQRIHDKIQWRCSEGHVWWNSWGNVQRGQWCAQCRLAQRARRKKGD